jgi:RimJ/RimL family protein N-acetyltransferase
LILEWGYEDLTGPFAERHGFPSRDFGSCRTLWGFGDEVLGCVVVHDWNPEAQTIEVSALSIDKMFPNRAATRAVLEYAFGIGCQAVVSRTDAANEHVRKWAKALGAQEYIIPRLRGRTASEAICIMTDDAWRRSRWRKA